MGYDLHYYEGDEEQTPKLRISNLTYNYNWWIECHQYWYAPRDYDNKTVGDAINIMEASVSKMIADGIRVVTLDEICRGVKCTHLEDMLSWLITNYADLIKMPRHWTIKLS